MIQYTLTLLVNLTKSVHHRAACCAAGTQTQTDPLHALDMRVYVCVSSGLIPITIDILTVRKRAGSATNVQPGAFTAAAVCVRAMTAVDVQPDAQAQDPHASVLTHRVPKRWMASDTETHPQSVQWVLTLHACSQLGNDESSRVLLSKRGWACQSQVT